MNYVMVTGPMGAGKSTFMRSLPKPQGNFIVPDNVPDMWLDFSCEINGKMFYEIDAPTATGKMWIDWLKAADIQIIVGNGLKEPDEHFLELWEYLQDNTPNTKRLIVLNRTKIIERGWEKYGNETLLCVGMGETIDEETAIASESDILAVLKYLDNNL
jgi:energy-coupling factor transporter ATP-binding protein EcfA2